MPPCCYVTLACVHMVQTTLPRLRAYANYHLPSIKRPPREQLLGYQVGVANDKTTRQRGALDVAEEFMKLTFRRGVLVRRQQRWRPSSMRTRSAICEHGGLGSPIHPLLQKSPILLLGIGS